jgi:GAF domain-containing protein
MAVFVVPAGVHVVPEPGGRLVVLNENTGSWHALNRAGADLYQELGRTSDLDHVVDQLARRYNKVLPDRIRDDIERMVADLVRRGLLEPAGSYLRRPDAVLMATPASSIAAPRRHRVLTAIAFLVALVLLRLPFRTSTKAVTTMKRWLANQDTTQAEALRRLATARLVSRYYPGRVACLELSLTAVLTAALLRQRIDWCFGFASDPQRFHSWIEVGGMPVTEPTDDPISPTYRRVVRV